MRNETPLRFIPRFEFNGALPCVWRENSPVYHVPGIPGILFNYGNIRERARWILNSGGTMREILGIPQGMEIWLDFGDAFVPADSAEEYALFVRRQKENDPLFYAIAPSASHNACSDFVPQFPWWFVDNPPEPDWMTSVAKERGDIPMVWAVSGGSRALCRRRESSTHAIENVAIACQMVRGFAYPARPEIHVIGWGGYLTVCLALILGVSRISSSGWWRRAAFGAIHIPYASGERVVVEATNWRRKNLSPADSELLSACQCPVCERDRSALFELGVRGFRCRAVHNLYTLLALIQALNGLSDSQARVSSMLAGLRYAGGVKTLHSFLRNFAPDAGEGLHRG